MKALKKFTQRQKLLKGLCLSVFLTFSPSLVQSQEDDGLERGITDQALDAYEQFRVFVTKEWRPTKETRLVIQEFLDEEIGHVRSLAANAVFWEKQREWYRERGFFAKARCVENQLSALRSLTAIANSYAIRLEQMTEVKTISSEFFDELAQVGRVSGAMSRLHHVIGDCMIEVDLQRSNLGVQQELFTFSDVNRRPVELFQTLSPLSPSRRPLK